MKKILLSLLLGFTFLASQAQGVKISAMPTITTSVDEYWFPIIHLEGSTWVNYRTQGSTIVVGVNARVDSIINNWPAGGSARFGVSGEDDAAAQNRNFNLSTYTFDIVASASSIHFDENSFASLVQSGTTLGRVYNSAGVAGIYAETVSSNLGIEINMAGTPTIYYLMNTGTLNWWGTNSGIWNWQIRGLATGTAANVLYFDNSTKEVTWGAAPSGGGGGSNNDSLFGVTDNVATANRAFSQSANTFTWSSAYSGVGAGIAMANSSTGTTLSVTNNGGSSTMTLQNSGAGNVIFATATSGTAISGQTTSGANAASFTSNPSSTNTTVNVLTVSRLTSSTAAASMAGAIQYIMEVNLDGSTTRTSNRLVSMWTDAADATRTSKLIIEGVSSATTNNIVEFLGDGNVRQLIAGKGYGLKSPDGTQWYITISNAGAISASTSLP